MKAIVIGAGFAGLAAALRLSQAGLEVLVLEQQNSAGGKAIGWEGVPTGPTVLTLPEVPQQIFAAFGQAAPHFQAVSPLTHYRFADGRGFAPELNLEATLAQLSPEEASHYRRLLGEAQSLYQGVRDPFIFGPPPNTARLGRYGLGQGRRAHPFKSLLRLVESGPYLTPFFLRFATYMGANPYRAPAVLHNIAWVELGLGVYHLPGGLQALAQALYQLALAQGIAFAFGQKVLHLQNDASAGVRAVQTQSGWHSADIYVSSADRSFTQQWLGFALPKEELGVAGFTLLMRLSEAVPLAHRVFFSPNYPAEWAAIGAGQLPPDPTLYLHTDGHSAFLMVNAPNLQQLSPQALQSQTQSYAQHLLQKLAGLHPLPIADWKAMSPQDYSLTSHQGALYGRAPHGLLGTLRPGWQVGSLRNLAQVGGTVHPGGGVPLSLLSGWNGAQGLLRQL